MEFDLRFRDFGGKAGLCQVNLVSVDGHDAFGSATLHLDGVKSGVAADVEDGLAGEIQGNRLGEMPPFILRIISQEMVRRGLNAAKPHVVKPRSNAPDALFDFMRA